jgi:hypothetical protein
MAAAAAANMGMNGYVTAGMNGIPQVENVYNELRLIWIFRI